MSKKIETAIRIEFAEQEGELASVEFIRSAVRWFDNRLESHNANKSVPQLLDEYAKMIIDYDKS